MVVGSLRYAYLVTVLVLTETNNFFFHEQILLCIVLSKHLFAPSPSSSSLTGRPCKANGMFGCGTTLFF